MPHKKANTSRYKYIEFLLPVISSTGCILILQSILISEDVLRFRSSLWAAHVAARTQFKRGLGYLLGSTLTPQCGTIDAMQTPSHSLERDYTYYG